VSQVIVSGTIHDQELLSAENGFSNDRPCATRTSEPNDSDNQVKKKDTQIWHGSSYQGYKASGNAHKIAIRHRQAQNRNQSSWHSEQHILFNKRHDRLLPLCYPVKTCLSRMRRAAKRGEMLKTKKAGDGDRTRDVQLGKLAFYR
jgi:hypothetical protein